MFKVSGEGYPGLVSDKKIFFLFQKLLGSGGTVPTIDDGLGDQKLDADAEVTSPLCLRVIFDIISLSNVATRKSQSII